MGTFNINKLSKPYVAFVKYYGLYKTIEEMCKRYNKYYSEDLIKECINDYNKSNFILSETCKSKSKLDKDRYVIHEYLSKVIYNKQYRELTYNGN